MLNYFWSDLKEQKRDRIIEVDLGGTANIKLMSYDSFSLYKLGLPYRYNGGHA